MLKSDTLATAVNMLPAFKNVESCSSCTEKVYTEEESTEGESTKKKSTKEKLTKEEWTKEESTKEESTKEESTKEESTDEESTKEELTEEESTEEESTDDEYDDMSSVDEMEEIDLTQPWEKWSCYMSKIRLFIPDFMESSCHCGGGKFLGFIYEVSFKHCFLCVPHPHHFMLRYHHSHVYVIYQCPLF